ncbi:class I SAM-dependent methyltransferase [Marivirga harenae]|uniref:class I SAM-dependent DNA methyltransferase n=1 Tax=Marivirga harenae TaxID=2010992 RepID=UPI0026DFB4E5|nr:class I SAM-dependent methyltransferase [Marivirga harenae]WKV12709.1 class I SAM-dependent methyltransferase [Marivirga harenae]|tara:strand:- start:68230 stop:68970 length:741 start_codon:yes stop_codon:yes gene_type:complete
MSEAKKEWFNEWFGSPFYHILYKNRDEKEAQFFLSKLLSFLNIPKDAKLLDVACGSGRHSIFLNKQDFEVDGIDISERNIELAKSYENEKLHFHVQDMRESIKENYFNYAFNLFTSFGFFKSEDENQKCINSISDSLQSGGIFTLDFLNPYRVIHNLVKEEIKTIDGIDFHLKRNFDGESIIKEIDFHANGENYHFEERVKAIRRLSFLEYFRNANFMLVQTFGDYELNEYVPETSERMIFIVKKL